MFRQDVAQASPGQDSSSQLSNISSNLSVCEESQCDSTPTPDVFLAQPSSCNSTLHPSKVINQYLLEQVPHARIAVTHDRDWSSIIGLDSFHTDSSRFLSVVHSMNDIVLDNDTGLVFLELKEKDQNEMLSSDMKVTGLIESMKDGLTLDQYLFGFDGDQCLRLRELCDALRSGSTSQPILTSSFLPGHPERLLSLDELLNIWNRDFHAQDPMERQSIVNLRAELSLLSSQHADRPSCLLCLADALYRRFYQWAQREDLEEAICSYEEALSLIPNSHYQYLEILLGLCSSLYQRFYLLRHTDDLTNLLGHLYLHRDARSRLRSLLGPVESRLENFVRDSESTRKRPQSGTFAYSENLIKKSQVKHRDDASDVPTTPGLTRSDPVSSRINAPVRERKRAPLACTMCREHKIRCNTLGDGAACERCARNRLKCEYRTFGPGSPPLYLPVPVPPGTNHHTLSSPSSLSQYQYLSTDPAPPLMYPAGQPIPSPQYGDNSPTQSYNAPRLEPKIYDVGSWKWSI